MAELPHRITILGAGVAGLTLAILLARSRHQVDVLEKSSAPDDGGTGIQVSPNGVAVLNALGLESEAAKAGVPARQVQICDSGRGRIMAVHDLAAYGRTSCPYLLFRRSALVGMLADAASTAGARIRRGVHVEAVAAATGSLRLQSGDGRPRMAAFLVGADGLHSVVREFLNPGAPPPLSSHLAWRSVIDGPLPFDLAPGDVRLVVGAGGHVVLYRTGSQPGVNLVAIRRIRPVAGRHLPTSDDPENLRRSFLGFGGGIPEVLGSVESAGCWHLQASPIARSWHGQGAVLAGDALHPVLPFLAQGGNQALEDAWVLARLLASGLSLSEALTAYMRARRWRRRQVAMATNVQGMLYHLPGSIQTPLFSLHGLAGELAPALARTPLHWIYRKDVTRQV